MNPASAIYFGALVVAAILCVRRKRERGTAAIIAANAVAQLVYALATSHYHDWPFLLAIDAVAGGLALAVYDSTARLVIGGTYLAQCYVHGFFALNVMGDGAYLYTLAVLGWLQLAALFYGSAAHDRGKRAGRPNGVRGDIRGAAPAFVAWRARTPRQVQGR